MPPSQLKRLKASLREQGIVGPQKSKKQKKQLAQNGDSNEKRVNRASTLVGIREQFNPFEVKTSARGPKFDVTSNKTLSGRITKSVAGRPGVKKSLGEENRRKTLLTEMRRRNKVGGIIDKRFGENDPSMAPEDKMLERFTQEKLGARRHKNTSAFDLEDDEADNIPLTHMGKSLSFDEPIIADDFDDTGLELSDEDDHPSDEERQKRRRDSDLGESGDDADGVEHRPERKKSKQEVMKELIAKSKLHKYERQEAKDADEDLREELDKEMSGIHALLRGLGPKAPPLKNENTFMSMNPERAAILTGEDKIKFDKEYEIRLRQLAQDRKAAPTERTKTDDEKLIADARRLQELETRRLRRMKGEAEDSDEGEEENKGSRKADKVVLGEFEEEEDFNEDFGLGSGIGAKPDEAAQDELDLDFEDDYVPDDLVASGSDVDEADYSVNESESGEGDVDDDDDFIGGLLTQEESTRPEFLTGANAPIQDINLPESNGVEGNLPFVFTCPENHAEFLKLTKDLNVLDLPLVVQRIRKTHHAALIGTKEKLAKFTVALIDHVSYLTNQTPLAPMNIVEVLIRHIHSLSRDHPLEAANAFRRHLRDIQQERPLALSTGDLIILTSIGTIFPSSDQFHQVVTPAMLVMGWNLGQKIPRTLADYVSGVYVATLFVQYQKLSKRFVPEVVNFIMNSVCALAPVKVAKIPGYFPYHEPKQHIRLINDPDTTIRSLALLDTMEQDLDNLEENTLKTSLMAACIKVIDVASETWVSNIGFYEIFEPISKLYAHLSTKGCLQHLTPDLQTLLSKHSKKLTLLLSQAKLARRPLKLHNHKPLAIKMSIPKFEEGFNPDRHYDPDRERNEASKLKAEYKKEKKGAMRELRKDANFIARESLREKKERDAAYEKKFKRLHAEIQGEEGRESKAYEREKGFRKKGRN